ncbi:MAG: hypothetical protein PWQ45_685 [Thermosipho sp. (in: thermotogales)]|nr:hypothetical protein [Thermosipho sp. (in: thermotogales)]
MQFCVSKIRSLLFCPKKFLNESKEEVFLDPYLEKKTKKVIKTGGKIKKGVLSTKLFNFKLIASNVEVISNNIEIYIISHRNGKKLYQYHYIESAAYGYIFSKHTEKKINVIFKSKYYNVTMPWKKYLKDFIDIVEELKNYKEISPRINPECKFCKYNLECTNILIKEKNLSLLRGIGSAKLEKLFEHNIFTLDDLIKNKDVVENIFGEKGKRLILQATAFIENKPILISKVEKLKNGIFLDIESYHDFHFLFGILKDNEYIPFFSFKREVEEKTFLQLIDFLKKQNAPIYHYFNYEPIQIKKLATKYKVKNKVKFEFIDIYKIISSSLAIPTISYSLKVLAKYFGFKWRTNLNGSSVIQKFEEYKKSKDKAILNEILMYNEDDVRATKLLFDIVNQFSK